MVDAVNKQTDIQKTPTPTIENLLKEVSDARLGADLDLIKKAYNFAKELHKDQKRKSGEPYIIHPLSVAMILAKMNMDESTIAAALLHDTVEDTNTTLEDLSKEFSPEIAMLVDGVTKLSAFSVPNEQNLAKGTAFKSRADRQAENLRKIFISMAKDIRVILIKFADRLHNMRTLGFMRKDKQERIANETLTIYAAIASRLGIWKMKWELEDLSFSYLNPTEYKHLKELVDAKMADKEKIIQNTVSIITKALEEDEVDVLQISGRRKHIYSVWQKINQRGKDFSEIYDLFAIRVIVNDIESCYKVLGAVHKLWTPMKDRIKDYIARPKSNGYRSLHTTVYGPGGEPVEIQIRTMEMHMVNEYGPAAHWAYKERKNISSQDEYPWVKRIIEWQKDSKDVRDYIDNIIMDINESEVFVYTPKGDAIDLPAGSTPIDFAYRIHTDVGHKCVGAKVNSNIVPLNYRLQNGDRVEIITSKNANPSLDWLNICRGTHTKIKIRQWFKKERREENILRGKDILEKELKRLQRMDKRLSPELMTNTELLNKLSTKLNFSNSEDLIASIGYGETSITQIIQKIKDELPKEQEEILIQAKKPNPKKDKLNKGVIVKGVDNVLVVFAKCCNPIPGDEIVGHWKIGTGVAIHRRNCPNIQADRITEVRWDESRSDRRYHVKLEIEAKDRRGLLAEFMNVLSEMRIPTNECSAKVKKNKAIVTISIEVFDKAQLNSALRKLSLIKGVESASRGSLSDDIFLLGKNRGY